MDGDPPPVVLKSEKEEIDIFFCPDPSSGSTGLHPAAPDSSEEDIKPSTSTSTTRRSTSSKKRLSGLGSAQRNLSKAFDDVPCSNAAKSNLFGAFNATVEREPKTLADEFEDEQSTEEEDIPKPFRASAINTQKDLMLLNGTSATNDEGDQLNNDVKLSLFSPQKSQCGSAQKWELPDIGSFSPSFLLGPSDDRFFQLEPDADYNFSLADTEGIADLFDYKI